MASSHAKLKNGFQMDEYGVGSGNPLADSSWQSGDQGCLCRVTAHVGRHAPTRCSLRGSMQRWNRYERLARKLLLC